MLLNQNYFIQFFESEGVVGVDGFFKKYRPYVLSICLKYSDSADEAEDNCQEVLLKLGSKLDAYKANSRFSTWLYSVTRNYCFDQLKVKQRNQLKLQEYLLTQHNEVLEEAPQDLRNLYIGTITQLEEEDQRLLKQKYIDSLSIAQIAQINGVSESCIKMRISRAKEKVRRLLKMAS